MNKTLHHVLFTVLGYLMNLMTNTKVVERVGPMTRAEAINDLRERSKALARLLTLARLLMTILEAEEDEIKADWESLGASPEVHPLLTTRSRWKYDTKMVEALALETGRLALLNKLDKAAFHLVLDAGEASWAEPASPEKLIDVVWERDWIEKVFDVGLVDADTANAIDESAPPVEETPIPFFYGGFYG